MQCSRCKKIVGWTFDINFYPLNMFSLCQNCRDELVELIERFSKREL